MAFDRIDRIKLAKKLWKTRMREQLRRRIIETKRRREYNKDRK